MANTRSTRLGCFFVLIFCTNLLAASESEECERDILFYIRSRGLEFYLDATDANQVKVERFTGADPQLWKFQPAGRPGLYYIVNEHHRKVLDFIPGEGDILRLAVTDLEHKTQQKWNFDIKDNLVNAANGKNVDIHNGEFKFGNIVKLWEDNGCACQAFQANRKE